MDIKAKVEQIVKKIQSDPKLVEKFSKDPVSVVEELVGIDLPNDQIDKVVDLVKAKLNLDKAGDLLGGLGKMFGKEKVEAAKQPKKLSFREVAHYFVGISLEFAAVCLKPGDCHESRHRSTLRNDSKFF